MDDNFAYAAARVWALQNNVPFLWLRIAFNTSDRDNVMESIPA